MHKPRITAILFLAVTGLGGISPAIADQNYKVATLINAGELASVAQAAPADRVSDQAIRHVAAAKGNLGIGVVHRPVVEAGGPIAAIRHNNQSEVYRVMAGTGTLVTSSGMRDSKPLDADGYIVRNLTGPSDIGVIEETFDSRVIGEGDIVIIPAGVAHGFSEITEGITYMVVRIDPDRLVELK